MIDDALLEELETRLLAADVGVEATESVLTDLHRKVERKELGDAAALLEALLEPARRGPSRALPAVLGLGLAAAVIGLAGPAWERLPQPVEQRTDAVVIALDLSLSMLAEDVRPSRLTRARQKIADLLTERREGREDR